ncbi:MAG: PaaI family thioesterase [Solirubrobacterales bacterium]|nr:PaaI family thioesterase [Solirubrobacterales bacterium]
MSDKESSAQFELPVGGFMLHCGIEWLEIGDEFARAQVVIGPQHLQPMGLVHGGLYATIAESLASAATYLAVAPKNKVAMGLSNSTSFLAPISSGTAHATARRLHAGRTTWVWDVEISDDDGRRCAVTRMTIAVRDAD